MDYALTLNNIFISDIQKAGYRAVDLATLSRNRHQVPLCIVLNSQALEDFVSHNNLLEKGGSFLSKGDYDSLRREFMNGVLPDKLMAELKENYESLGVGKTDAANIVQGQELPRTCIIASPNYLVPQGYCVFQNVQGLNQVVAAIKTSWALLFSKEAFEYRASKGIKEFFSAIIIQQMPLSTASASCSDFGNALKVKTWFGLPDFHNHLQKDCFEVNKETLQIQQHQVNHQVYRIGLSENGQLDNIPLEGAGSRQKVDDKTVIEIARLTKRTGAELKQAVTSQYTMQNSHIYLLFADRNEQSISESAVQETIAPQADSLEPNQPELNDTPGAPVHETEINMPEPEALAPEQNIPIPEPTSPAPKEHLAMPDNEGMPEQTDQPEMHLPESDIPVPESEISMPEPEVQEKEEEILGEQEYDFLDELDQEHNSIDKEAATPVEKFPEVQPAEASEMQIEPENNEPEQREDANEFVKPVEQEQKEVESNLAEPAEPEVSQASQVAREEMQETVPEQGFAGELETRDSENVKSVAQDANENLAQEPVDERIEDVNHLKEMVGELDSLVSYGEESEVKHKLNELHDAVQRLRHRKS